MQDCEAANDRSALGQGQNKAEYLGTSARDMQLEDQQRQLWVLQMAEIFHPGGGLDRCGKRALKKMKVGSSNKECSICCQSFSKGQIIYNLFCKHIFHNGCLDEWLNINKKCPMCRFDLSAPTSLLL